MRSFVAAFTLVALAGCSTTGHYASHPADHDQAYTEDLPEAPAWKAQPIGSKPTLSQIQGDCEGILFAKGPACSEASKAILYEGEAGAPPAVKNAAPGLYQASLPVERGLHGFKGPALKVTEAQPTLEVRAWINTGQGFKRHHLHYLDAKLVSVVVE